jgi:hypothetical protein
MKTDSLTYTQITKDWGHLVNYLKLDSISIVGWSDEDCWVANGYFRQIKIKKLVAMGANLRPDSTAVNSWAAKKFYNLKKWLTQKLRKDTTANWIYKTTSRTLGRTPNIPIEDLSKYKSINNRWRRYY